MNVSISIVMMIMMIMMIMNIMTQIIISIAINNQ